MTVLVEPLPVEDLEEMLDQSSRGDSEAFMRFYDATHTCAYRLALTRARLLGLDDARAHRAAESETVVRYAAAWRQSAARRWSALSPLAWLLTLDLAPDS